MFSLNTHFRVRVQIGALDLGISWLSPARQLDGKPGHLAAKDLRRNAGRLGFGRLKSHREYAASPRYMTLETLEGLSNNASAKPKRKPAA